MKKISLVNGKIRVEETSPPSIIGEDHATDMAFLCDVVRFERNANSVFKLLGPNIGEVVMTPADTLNANDIPYEIEEWDNFYTQLINPTGSSSGGGDWYCGTHTAVFTGNSRFYYFNHYMVYKTLMLFTQISDNRHGDLYRSKITYDANGVFIESENNIPQGTVLITWYARYEF